MGQPSPVGVTSSTNYIITSGFISGRIDHLSTSSDSDLPAPYEDFQLFQNYPNPFTTSTTIHVVLGIYSILGKHIATLFNEYRSPGFYYVSFNGTTLSPGVYIYKIQTPQFQAVKMMNRME